MKPAVQLKQFPYETFFISKKEKSTRFSENTFMRQRADSVELLSPALMLLPPPLDRLVGLVVRRPPREWKIPGSIPACDGIFSGSSHAIDLKIDTPVATLPGTWRYRVSTGTGRPGISIL